jgi:competence protein ComEA
MPLRNAFFAKTLAMLLGAGLLLSSVSAGAQAQVGSSEAVEKRVNINEADAETLADVLVGVGASKARAIVKYREENGPFTTIDQLVDVNGIGESILNTNKEKMTLE